MDKTRNLLFSCKQKPVHALLPAMLLILADTGIHAAPDPAIQITAPDNPAPVQTGIPFDLKLAMNAGSEQGKPVDWWLVADTPYGWYSFDLPSRSWRPGISVAYQNALVNFDLTDLVNITGLPAGKYTFYFGIDTNMNSKLNMNQAYYQKTAVTVSSTDEKKAGTTAFQSPICDTSITLSNLTNGYAELSADNLRHTGLDLIPKRGCDHDVYAAAGGTVRRIDFGTIDPEVEKAGKVADNHDMGNVVIIDHNNGKGPFTLYAHLSVIDVENGAEVSKGQRIGTLGKTGCSEADDKRKCGVHLHFEVKHYDALGNLGDKGPRWGYVPRAQPPNHYGYINPWPYLDYPVATLDTPIAVEAAAEQAVLTGPDPDQYKFVVGKVAQGDKFVAFARYNDWYQIYLPAKGGPGSGWIQARPADEGSGIFVVAGTGQEGLSVCASANACSGTTRKQSAVWDRQWVAALETSPAGSGCGSQWIKIHTGLAPGQTGWVCGEWLNRSAINPDPAPSSPKPAPSTPDPAPSNPDPAPSTPLVFGGYDTPGEAFGVTGTGDMIYVADWEKGLQMIDVSDPETPVIAGNFDTNHYSFSYDGRNYHVEYAVGVAAKGTIVYVALGGHDMLLAIDASDPANPVITGLSEIPAEPLHLFRAGGIAYLTTLNDQGIYMFDIGNPASPVAIAVLNPPGETENVDADGNKAYVADGSAGLQIYDITHPAVPALAGHLETPGGYASAVAADGNMAYVAVYYADTATNRLLAVDTSDPANPVITGSIILPAYAIDADAAYGKVYVADTTGRRTIDVSNPGSPVLVSSINTPYRTEDIDINAADGRAYVAAGKAGMVFFDIAPANP